MPENIYGLFKQKLGAGKQQASEWGVYGVKRFQLMMQASPQIMISLANSKMGLTIVGSLIVGLTGAAGTYILTRGARENELKDLNKNYIDALSRVNDLQRELDTSIQTNLQLLLRLDACRATSVTQQMALFHCEQRETAVRLSSVSHIRPVQQNIAAHPTVTEEGLTPPRMKG